MSHFKTLYLYEMKKIMKRKLMWITLLICLVVLGMVVTSSLFGTYWVDGKEVDTHYHMYQVDMAYRKALSGRAVNQELLQETMEAYGKIPREEARYTLTEEYQTYARPYSEIFNLIRNFLGRNTDDIWDWSPNEEEFYAARLEQLEANWRTMRLSESEKEFWRKKEAQIQKPITCFYQDGYIHALYTLNTAGICMLLFVAISLSNLFAEEHVRRTDQMILSSAKGKTLAFWAKISAGISVAMLGAALMAVVVMGLALGIFGAAGFQAVLQFCYFDYSYPLTVGQACLLAYGIFILAAIVQAVFVMVLSEALHNNLATLAVATVLIIAGGVFGIPAQYRVPSQIWNSLPITYLNIQNIFDERTIPIFGHCFASWQIVPVIYILCSAVIAVIGRRIYLEYQVTGR
ncbi:MAG: hypothetical protein NC094_07250 [Bacteroidales bacterium]|nr:hypothetical protein [Lachnoclostridium sp.]MCM1384419.1 hypothetical protein [Lachnoclostridium sp.]MCM1465199.1 hypothetical protein [Bacteroidales bacterium]